MRKTGIATLCDKCGNEFEIFSDDGKNDSTMCWNYCPYCGAKRELWLKIIQEGEKIELGIGCDDVIKIFGDII